MTTAIKLDDYHFYQPPDIEQFAQIYFHPQETQDKIYAILNPTCDRYKQAPETTQIEFYRQLQEFIRLYGFLSQILTIPDAELEKFYQFSRHLIRLLPVAKTRLPLELQQNIQLESYQIKSTYQGQIELKPGLKETPGTSLVKKPLTPDEQLAPLSQIIAEINQRFGTNFNQHERVFMENLETQLDDNQSLKYSLKVNDPGNIKLNFDNLVKDLIQEAIASHFDLYKQFNDNEEFRVFLLSALFNRFLERANSGQKRNPVS